MMIIMMIFIMMMIRQLEATGLPKSSALGLFGIPGLTAYLGLMEIGKPKVGPGIIPISFHYLLTLTEEDQYQGCLACFLLSSHSLFSPPSQAGETIVISSAAGQMGHLVGQIAKYLRTKI